MTKSVSEWSTVTGIKESTIYMRMNGMGWSEEAAVSTPLMCIRSKIAIPESDEEGSSKGRTCLRCGKYKSRNRFYKNPKGFNGLGSTCKKCHKEIATSEETKLHKRDLYDDRKVKGLCVGCSSPDLVTNVHCRRCWFRDAASRRCGGTGNVDQLLSMWEEQDGKCYYTGVDLIPGENAWIDHQLPRSRGGQDHIDNLKWVSKYANLMKSDMTHEEFIELCSTIANRFGK